MQHEWKDDGLFYPLGMWLIFFPIVGFTVLLISYIPVKIIELLTTWEHPWNVWWWLAEHIFYDIFYTYTSTILLMILVARYSYFRMWYVRTLEQLRRREFMLDVQRYIGSPYVPGLALEYLMQPCPSFDGKDIDDQYTFYRHVVSWFRNTVYLHKNNQFVGPRYTYLQLISPYLWYVSFGGIVISGVLIYIATAWGFHYFWNELWLGYAKVAFGVPLFILGCWVLSITWGFVRYRSFTSMFNKDDYVSEVKWIEVMPGTYFGESFVDANKQFQTSLMEIYGESAKGLSNFPKDIYPEQMPRNIQFYHYSGDKYFDNIGSNFWDAREAKAIYQEKPNDQNQHKKKLSFKKKTEKVISIQNYVQEKENAKKY
ncbi:hypothetical protein [Bacillus sp. Marseille-P3661]|uniref:hypothetical protein n=1 Tax=Bacillus sp. Marseille-P3661 TaxID=1936234 RepID=UPI000C84565F|nr:hypothetical protein [Bacillus sp. Marseille-P3661]